MKNRLQEIRWEKDWSLTKLSQKSGVPKPTITLIENKSHGYAIKRNGRRYKIQWRMKDIGRVRESLDKLNTIQRTI